MYVANSKQIKNICGSSYSFQYTVLYTNRVLVSACFLFTY
jgi:hypothetical protein